MIWNNKDRKEKVWLFATKIVVFVSTLYYRLPAKLPAKELGIKQPLAHHSIREHYRFQLEYLMIIQVMKSLPDNSGGDVIRHYMHEHIKNLLNRMEKTRAEWTRDDVTTVLDCHPSGKTSITRFHSRSA